MLFIQFRVLYIRTVILKCDLKISEKVEGGAVVGNSELLQESCNFICIPKLCLW